MKVCFKIFNLRTLAIFSIIILIFCISNNIFNNNSIENSNYTKEVLTISNAVNVDNLLDSKNIVFNEEWKLEIPNIKLEADIAEGTSSEILNKYIGHFEETSKENGNVALAAHNRGYPVNYFERLKELEIGDEVYYTYNGVREKYIVNFQNIIKDTDVKVLEDTEENILTLITCVENRPEYRRCIQAIKIN